MSPFTRSELNQVIGMVAAFLLVLMSGLPGHSMYTCVQLFEREIFDLDAIASKVSRTDSLDRETFENVKILLENDPKGPNGPHYQSVFKNLAINSYLSGSHAWHIYSYISSKASENRKWPIHYPDEKKAPEIYRQAVTGALTNRPLYEVISSVPREGQLETIQKVLEDLSREKPGILPREWMDIAWDNVKKVETGFQLLQLMYKLRGPPDSPFSYKSSLEVLAEATGISLNVLENIKDVSSERQLGSFYVNLLEITIGRRQPPFKNIEFDPQLFKKENIKTFIEALKNLRDYLFTNGNTDAELQKIFGEVMERRVRQGFVFSKDTVDTINNDLPLKILQELILAMKVRRLSVAKTEVIRFKKSWFNLEPLLTLFSRYSGKEEWQPLVPKLLEALQAMIKGEFKDYRYSGSKKARDQKIVQEHMRLLTSEEARSKWRDGVTEVRLAKEATKFELEQNKAILQRLNFIARKMILKNNVSTHNFVYVTEKEKQKTIDVIVEGGQDPRLIKAKLDKIMPDAQLLNLLLESIDKYSDSKIVYATIAFIRNTKDLFNVPEAVKKDIFLLRKVSRSLRRGGNERIILTTINSDPRFMMALGSEPVDCASCVGYKGGNAHGLLGWVIDPNVQALAGYVLDKGHFVSRNDFERVVKGIRDGSARVRFDGNMKQAIFTVEGEEIRTEPIRRGYLRRVVKLGDAIDYMFSSELDAAIKQNGGPLERVGGIVLETQHLPGHQLSYSLEKQALRMAEKWAKDMNLQINKGIEVGRSRSRHGGQHSDFPYGQHINGYRISD
tara:strand:- start:16861 stop:19221 length:2361 start_codon:yes stop_codon:yes gene_type:complete